MLANDDIINKNFVSEMLTTDTGDAFVELWPCAPTAIDGYSTDAPRSSVYSIHQFRFVIASDTLTKYSPAINAYSKISTKASL